MWPRALQAVAAGAAITALSARAAADEAPRCPPEPPLEGGGVQLPLALVLLAGDALPIGGSAAVGKPTRGTLWAGVELQASGTIELAGGHHWGTAMTVRSIERAAREVARCHPGAPPLIVGDMAREGGGWLRPHRSHQTGLDADLGYFYRVPASWYVRATRATFDPARTWTLVRSLIEGGNVETIFIDRSVQQLLREHVATLPAAQQPPEGVFRTPARRAAIIQHAWGHATHLHVRFRDPDAERLGARIDRLRRATRR
jgi:penicillin-insensitive murein endopeptidase